jgi:hypothetical protein
MNGTNALYFKIYFHWNPIKFYWIRSILDTIVLFMSFQNNQEHHNDFFLDHRHFIAILWVKLGLGWSNGWRPEGCSEVRENWEQPDSASPTLAQTPQPSSHYVPYPTPGWLLLIPHLTSLDRLVTTAVALMVISIICIISCWWSRRRLGQTLNRYHLC